MTAPINTARPPELLTDLSRHSKTYASACLFLIRYKRGYEGAFTLSPHPARPISCRWRNLH